MVLLPSSRLAVLLGVDRWSSSVMARGVTRFCDRFDPAGTGCRDAAKGGGARAAERPEEGGQGAGEQVGSVVGGPVAATVELAPGDDVGVVAFGEPADRPEVEGKARQADGDRWRAGGLLGVLVLVVEAGRRRRGVGQPVDRALCGSLV